MIWSYIIKLYNSLLIGAMGIVGIIEKKIKRFIPIP